MRRSQPLWMSENALHINRFLRRNRIAAGLLEAVERDAALLQATRRLLAADLRGHCLHATLEGAQLWLLTDGPVWASRLRFAAPELVAGLRQVGMAATEVRVRVAPAAIQVQPTDGAKTQARLSAATAAHLKRAAATMDDADLAAALLRLARRGAPCDQETARGRGL